MALPMNKSSSQNRKWVLLAAVAAVPLFASLPARAQFQRQGDGHALDANNQVGSGGYNARSQTGARVTSGDIIYNNVTGLGGFTGPLQTTDPAAFRGPTFFGSADRFIAQSSPAAVRGTPSATYIVQSPTPYYGVDRGAPPPSGFVPVVNAGGSYVPPNTFQASSFYSNTINNNGLRTGASYGGPNAGPTLGINGPYVPYSNDVIRLGPTDATNQQSLLIVSPLSGIGQAPLDNSNQNYFLSRTQVLQSAAGRNISPQALQQLQRELEEQGQPTQQNPNSDQSQQPQQPSPELLNKPLPKALESPVNKPLDSSIGGSALSKGQPLNSDVQTQQDQFRTLSTPAAAAQLPAYDELRDRLKAYQSHTQSPAEREAAFEQQQSLILKNKPKPPGTPSVPGTPAPSTPATAVPTVPGVGVPAPAPGRATVAPGVPQTPSRTKPTTPRTDLGALVTGTKTEPVHITSLATGVRARGLAGLLKTAEELMKDGKFASAIDQYNVAQQVAPNNPLIAIGQANAELGAASYRDAEQHLRQAFASDDAVLHAQFDLSALMGEARVRSLMADLKDLAAKEPTSEMPAFLLAYLNYNTGHEAEAMKYLADVEKREGKPDPIVARMREHWYVPGTPDLNK